MSDSQVTIKDVGIGIAIGSVAALLVLLAIKFVFTGDSSTEQIATEPVAEQSFSVEAPISSLPPTTAAPAASFDVETLHNLEAEISAGTIEPDRQLLVVDELLAQLATDTTVAGREEIQQNLFDLRSGLTAAANGDTSMVTQAAQQAHGAAHAHGHHHH